METNILLKLSLSQIRDKISFQSSFSLEIFEQEFRLKDLFLFWAITYLYLA